MPKSILFVILSFDGVETKNLKNYEILHHINRDSERHLSQCELLNFCFLFHSVSENSESHF